MSNNDDISESAEDLGESGVRRVLIVTNAARAAFQTQLASAGYETLATTPGMALRAVTEFVPDVLLMELGNDDGTGESDHFTLVRQLRTKAATYALPIVLIFDEDGFALRQTASNVGVDDYFAFSTPFPEVNARLNALFWRIEAGRRASFMAGNQRLEIENFLLLLNAVREDSRAGLAGSLAVLRKSTEAWQSPSQVTRAGALRDLFGFLKLHLRRLDAVAFYGPDALLAYMPGMDSQTSGTVLSRLRDVFVHENRGTDISIGLASFPADTADVEKLLERCEASASYAASEPVTNPYAQSSGSEHLELFVSESVDVPAKRESGVQPEVRRDANDVLVKSPGPVRPLSSEVGKASDPGTLRRILLAVSDPQRMVKLNSLLRSAGYEVRAAFDGEQALNLLRIERPDLLVLDSDLDKVDGLETVRRLRKQGGGKLSATVLFMNSVGDASTVQEALALGVRKVLTVPFDATELLASVGNAINTE